MSKFHRIAMYLSLAAILTPSILRCQFNPVGAHVNLYFPQLADGGPASQQWQTTFIFCNPSTTNTASVTVYLHGNDGADLNLDFGSGATSTISLSIPPAGTRTVRSLGKSPTTVTGWAFAASDVPVQATVLFGIVQNGVGVLQLSAPATLPSPLYRSFATRFLGIAVANVLKSQNSILVTVLDSNGVQIAQATQTLPPLGHTSLNIYSLFPKLQDFTGSVAISSQSGLDFIAWTLNSDGQTLSTLPPGQLEWPVSHWDRIWLVYTQVYNAAQLVLKPTGVDLSVNPPVSLTISYDPVINAFANRTTGTVQINIALSELISDSPSELAFAIAHELGHQIQYHTGVLAFVPNNSEFDADQWGMLLSLVAGYDPYASAGTLAKLSMATGGAGLVSQMFDNISGDLHGSFNSRIDTVYQLMEAICARSQYGSFCAEYKSVVHPHLPGSAPLVAKPIR